MYKGRLSLTCTLYGITNLLIKLFQRQKHNFSSDIILNIKTEENP